MELGCRPVGTTPGPNCAHLGFRLIYDVPFPGAAKSSSPVCRVVFCDKNYRKLLLHDVYHPLYIRPPVPN